MPNYTLKQIPADLYCMAEASAQSNFRSLNQELIHRVQMSFELEEAAASKVHAAWVQEALESGPARPASAARWRESLRQGLAKGRTRR